MSRGADLVSAIKRRIPASVKSRLSPAAKQRARDLADRIERRLSRAFPVKPPTGALPKTRVAGRRLRVTAESVAAARAALGGLDPELKIESIDVTVSGWRRPYAGWSGRLGPIVGLARHSVRLPRRGKGQARVRAQVVKPVAAHHLLSAALTALDPARSLPATLTGAMLVDGQRPPWLRALAVPVDGRRPSKESLDRPWATAPPMDVIVTGDAAASGAGEPVAVFSRYGLVASGALTRVLLDISYDNPMGRGDADPDPRSGRLTLDSGADGGVRWLIHNADGGSKLIASGRAGDPLDAAQRSALVALRALSTVDVNAADAPACAAVVAQLAATGLPIDAPSLSPATAALLGPELAEIVANPLPDRGAGDLDWEARSVAQRRAAMRAHDAGLNPGPARSDTALPWVTALVVTRRVHFVPRVVELLAAQTYPRLEIVLALHGAALDANQRDELARMPMSIEVIELPTELSLGEALSAATLRARGSLVTKVDDDDQYGPEHIWDLVLARRYSGATVVGKGPEFVYMADNDLTIRRKWTSETFSNVVAGGTIMISRGDLEAVGGWRPVPRSVDRTLLERVLHAGGLVYRTHPFGFVYTRHGEGHTWDPGGSDFFLRTSVRQWDGLPTVLLDQRPTPAEEPRP